MESNQTGKPRRNARFVAILAALAVVFIGVKLAQTTDDPSVVVEDQRTQSSSSTSSTTSDDAKPEFAEITFREFIREHDALRDNFRGRDSLTALIENKHIQWEGYIRNVTRHTTSFYVTIWPATQYVGGSASVTFDHSMEEELYAFRPNDHVRFEGVVKYAGGSVSIDGLAIELIE